MEHLTLSKIEPLPFPNETSLPSLENLSSRATYVSAGTDLPPKSQRVLHELLKG